MGLNDPVHDGVSNRKSKVVELQKKIAQSSLPKITIWLSEFEGSNHSVCHETDLNNLFYNIKLLNPIIHYACYCLFNSYF